MDLKDKNIGFALTGSFCTLKRTMEAVKALKNEGANIIPIMSEAVYNNDTRFGKAEDFIRITEEITGNSILNVITKTEPIGPKKMLDLLIIAPCTGNTLAKLSAGIADTSVTLAAKAHLRNSKPILIAVSTNDGLGNAAKNIGSLMNYKNIYFVPFSQDDYLQKPRSIVADLSMINKCAKAALEHKQLQPILSK